MSTTAISCRDCLAWGVLSGAYLCRPCAEFGRRNTTVDRCGACTRTLPLKKEHCRLCWCQAVLDRGPARRHRVLLPHVKVVRHHQLFLAEMPHPRDTVDRPPRRRGVGSGAKGHRRKLPPPVATRPRSEGAQLLLLTDLPRTYRYGQIDLRSDAVPDNPWLAWAQHIAHTLAEARGWPDAVHGELNRNLVMLLAGHLDGELVRVSDFHRVLRSRESCIKLTIEVLATMGVLLDDRPGTFDTWLGTKLAGLAPSINSLTKQWARTLREGGPRTRRRHESTIRNYIYAARPALQDWSTRYDHLREVVRDDVVAHLATLHGDQREMAAVAFRSLFGWAKRNGLIFRNPAQRITVPKAPEPVLQPLDNADVTRTAEAAATPHGRVFVVLCAVHAARPGHVRALQLGDVDLGNRRLTIAGRTRPLDELTHRVLQDWLAHRRERWPLTANRHLLINPMTAIGTGPVSHMWIKHALRNLPANLERIRIDRQLEEALACGADPLHLAAVFDLTESTAIRYANSARQLLQRPHEADTAPSSRTDGQTSGHWPDEPLGSS